MIRTNCPSMCVQCNGLLLALLCKCNCHKIHYQNNSVKMENYINFLNVFISSRNLGTLMYYLRTWVYYINIAMLTTCQVTWCTIIFWITTCKIGCTRKTIFLEYLLTVRCHLLQKNWACAQQYSASYTLIPILITQKL